MEWANPYRPPVTDEAPELGVGACAFRCFSPAQAVLATFVGSPVAGAILLAINYRRWNDQRRARNAILLGLFTTGVLAVASWFIPGFARMGLSIAVLAGVFKVADATQGAAYVQHLRAGGRKASTWAALGISLACTAAILVVTILIVYLSGDPPSPDLE